MQHWRHAPHALYVHVPFCPSKCHYCDFFSIAQAHPPIDAYVDAVLEEAVHTTTECTPEAINTVFVGGGTPTVLSAGQLSKLFQGLARVFCLTRAAEWTVEANPGTLDIDKLFSMREAGVNRLSIGVQTFRDDLLRALGRVHDRADVVRALELVHEVGFPDVSIDLMYGLPHQTLTDVQESVREALALGVTHISVYGLKVEQGTAFYAWQQQGALHLPEEEEEASMFAWICDYVAAHGYKQYEVSNFARAGHRSKHNTVYWRNESYYGIGAGAHGYVRGVRHENIKNVQSYIRAPHRARNSCTDVRIVEAMEEMMMLRLRLLDEGVPFVAFQEQFGVSLVDVFGHVLERLVQKGWIDITAEQITLTNAGLWMGNEVFGAFLGEARYAVHT